ncbi:MAG: apolipoprotein N-acyltransferase [Acidimicrobiia bacterium]|nr:apolipoprotein N-acyltransferase [Acidimicrobiia bacterium]
MRSFVASVAAGLLLVLAYPPRGWALLAPVAVAIFLTAIRSAETRRTAIASGAGFGLAFFGFLFPWLAELGVIALVPLLLLQAAFPTLYAGLLYRVKTGPAWFLASVGGWALMELVRERFPLGGFPWGMLGYPAGEFTATRNATQWLGTSGWSVLIASLAAGVALYVTTRQRRDIWYPVFAGALFFLVAGLGGVFPNPASGQEIRVAIVQGSTPCPGTHCPDERALTYASHLDLTSRLAAGSLDLVVWPEGSTGGFRSDPVNSPKVAAAIGEQARRLGAVFLVGGDRPISDTEWINANVGFDTTGTIVGEYRKRHPVPFGEYIPARSLFDWIPELSAIPRDMVPGEGVVLFDLDGEKFGSVISFESSFARYGRDTVKSGAGLLVVATNQGSYPYSVASDQLIGMTRMRSAELGVDVVHSAVTGRSTIITDAGVVGPKTALAEPAVITGTVQMREGSPTLYTRWGDWVQVLAALSLFLLLSPWRRVDESLIEG